MIFRSVITERDEWKKELAKAKEAYDKIGLMLANTKAKAGERYYKGKHKK